MQEVKNLPDGTTVVLEEKYEGISKVFLSEKDTWETVGDQIEDKHGESTGEETSKDKQELEPREEEPKKKHELEPLEGGPKGETGAANGKQIKNALK